MNVWDGLHWNIYEILPFQRNFNFVNSERSIGKTYTSEFFILDKCINSEWQFVYIVRTKDQKKKGALEKGFEKVIREQFPDLKFEFSSEQINVEVKEEEKEYKKTLGYCIALSEENSVKTMSFPRVKYMLFDEYVIEETSNNKYYNGWNEPDALLKIYHTIDREEDRVICFLMGNNIRFHNPYHLHPAFRIPFTEKGQIWTSENVLFQNAIASKDLKKKKSKSKFVRMIEGTDYAEYATNGNYMLDNYSFIEPMKKPLPYVFTIEYNRNSYGVYNDMKNGKIFITNKIDKNCKFVYALTNDDHRENTMLTRSGKITHLNWLIKNYKLGNVRFNSMETKMKIERGILLLIHH